METLVRTQLERMEQDQIPTYTTSDFMKKSKANFTDTIPGYLGVESKPPMNTEFITQFVSADDIFRGKDSKFIGWPLLNELEIHALCLEYGDREFETEMPIVVGAHCRDPEFSRQYHQITDPDAARKNLATQFPMTDYILNLGRGKLVAAGGAIFQALNVVYRPRNDAGDIDFFFIGFDATPEGEKEAGELLEDIIQHLSAKFDDDKNDPNGHEVRGNFKVARSQNVTTILYDHINYQFVHRPYPKTGSLIGDIGMPIGGFDLFTCAIAYYLHSEDYVVDSEGEFAGKFYATPAGAFALATMTNILMTNRNSTSMVYRLKKYATRGANIMFPGTNRERLSRSSINAKLAYTRNLKHMPIKLPHISISSSCKATGEDVSDYGSQATANNYLSYSTVTIANIHALLAGKIDQYSAISDTWTNVYSDIKSSLFKAPGKMFKIASLTLTNMVINLLSDHYNICTERYIQKFKTTFNNIYGQCMKSQPDFDQSVYDSTLESLVWASRETLRQYNMQNRTILIAFLEAQEQRAISLLKLNYHMNSKNPLRQHTASHNPVITNAREWWGPENYVPFRVGFSDEIFRDLYWLFTRGQYNYIGANVFKTVLLPYFARSWALGFVENMVSTALFKYPRNLQSHYLITVTHHIESNHVYKNPVPEEDYPGWQSFLDTRTSVDRFWRASEYVRPVKIILVKKLKESKEPTKTKRLPRIKRPIPPPQ